MKKEKAKNGRPNGTKKHGQIRYLTDNELQEFFSQTTKNLKHELIFKLSYFYGCRAAEVSELRLENINLEEKTITIIAKKKGDVRIYSIPETIFSLLEKYLTERGQIQNQFLFPHRFKKLEPITTVGIGKLFQFYAKRANIRAHSPHDLRHSIAIYMVKQGNSIIQIQKWLRQKSAGSAQKYIGLNPDLP